LECSWRWLLWPFPQPAAAPQAPPTARSSASAKSFELDTPYVPPAGDPLARHAASRAATRCPVLGRLDPGGTLASSRISRARCDGTPLCCHHTTCRRVPISALLSEATSINARVRKRTRSRSPEPAILRMRSAINARIAWVRRSVGTAAHASSNGQFHRRNGFGVIKLGLSSGQ